MFIFKETFKKYVRKQLTIREAIVATGNKKNQSRMASSQVDLKPLGGDVITLDAGAFYTNTTGRACVIRMSSGVDLREDAGGLVEGGRYENMNDLVGQGLAKRWVLEGGTLISLDREKEVEGKKVTTTVKTLRKGFPGTGKRGFGFQYGDPLIRADASTGEDNYGIVPMPGIKDAKIRTKSAYGSLREAKVQFSCHNQRQLEILELLYMRPGYPVLLEWGWTTYIGNDGKRTSEFPHIQEFFNPDVTQEWINRKIIKNKQKSAGNYDGIMGIVKNFNFKARADGGYDCTTELVATGEIIESLKTTTIAAKNNTSGKWELVDGVKDIFVALTTYSELDYYTGAVKTPDEMFTADIDTELLKKHFGWNAEAEFSNGFGTNDS